MILDEPSVRSGFAEAVTQPLKIQLKFLGSSNGLGKGCCTLKNEIMIRAQDKEASSLVPPNWYIAGTT